MVLNYSMLSAWRSERKENSEKKIVKFACRAIGMKSEIGAG